MVVGAQVNVSTLVERVATSLGRAENGLSRLSTAVLAVPGMTSITIRHFFNNLCDFQGCSYLEIGTFRGATLTAASFRSPGFFVAVDNFSEFNQGRSVKDDLLATLCEFSSDCCVAFFDRDCWDMSQRLPPRMFNVFFYDGAHERASQENAILRFAHTMQDAFVLIVDDWNQPATRLGTETAIQKLGYVRARQWEFRTDKNGCPESWWNGLYVAVLARRSVLHSRTAQTGASQAPVGPAL